MEEARLGKLIQFFPIHQRYVQRRMLEFTLGIFRCVLPFILAVLTQTKEHWQKVRIIKSTSQLIGKIITLLVIT